MDGVMLANYKLRWSNIWDSERVRKEASLMWMIWHTTVAVNVWRRVISQGIDQNCLVCLKGITETVLHRFWKCLAVQRAWRWCKVIINHLSPAEENRESQTVDLSSRTDRDAHASNAVITRGLHS